MKTTAAVLFEAGKPFELMELDLDGPGPGEVLVKYTAAGLCHSDLHLTDGDLPPRFPIVGGHEGSGVIEEVGAGVTRVKPGDHVVCSFIPNCGTCRYCCTGRQNLCDMGATILEGCMPDGSFRFHSQGTDFGAMCMLGTFAERATVSQHSVVKVDDWLPLETAVLVGCGVPSGWGTAVNAGNLRAGDTAVIYGVGGLGINAVQGATAAGCKYVVVVDPVAFKRETALKFGATHAFADAASAAAKVDELTWGQGADAALKISVLDPSTDPDGWSWPKARQMFEERAHLLPVFRLRYLPTPLGLHHPIWVEDPEFDLDAHVRRVVCPAPGGMAEFCALVEQIYAHPLDRDRPLWQTWVVEGLDGGRVALVTLLHHAYSDGVGVLDMLAAFYNDTPDEAPVVAPPWEPPPLPSTRQRLGWALRDLPSRLGKIAPTVRAVRDRVRIEREFAKDGDRRVPPTFDRSAPPGPFQRGLSRSRRFSCESFPLAEVREVSKTLGVTINDVFLACVAGAVRRYLERCGSPPTDAMVATMPLAVTPAAERAHPGNYSSVDYVWLRADIADPLERLHATHLAAEATKQHFAQTKDADVGAVVELLPERLISGLARANARTKGRFDTFKNVVVSNVPGPREPRYLGRWRVDQWFSTGQISHGATLNMTVWSYCDQFNLCVMADAVAVRNTWELLGGFRASHEELLAAARAQATPKEMAT